MSEPLAPATVPTNAVLVTLPYSEVCCAMGVAGKQTWVETIYPLMAQLYDLEGRKFSFPITRSEAGLRN